MNVSADLFMRNTKGFYTDLCGYTHALYEQYTHCSKIIHAQILSVLDRSGIPYYLFAGSMVGFVRDQKMPPWMDDLDIMIFEEYVEEFWNVAALNLRECGFNCRPVDEPFEGGGAHILAMQMGNRRDHSVPLAENIRKTVPWAQVDVFFSSVSSEGFVKNLKGWGLYHHKNVPASLVFPGRQIVIDGQSFHTFQEIEKDILLEYGDVLNNIIVQTHDKIFLKAIGVPWSTFSADWLHFLEMTSSSLPIGVDPTSVEEHSYNAGTEFTSSTGMSLTEIVEGVIRARASTINLIDEVQALFSMDLKRIFPNIRISVKVDSVRYANHAAHLRSYFENIEFSNKQVEEHYEKTIGALNRLAASETAK